MHPCGIARRPGRACRHAREEITMIRSWLHHPLVWSPILAVAAQLLLAAAVAAVSGGGDFPRRR